MPQPSGTHPFAPFEWMLSLRYLRARRREGFISVIAGFSFLGIMLGVATLIIVMAVMNGFRQELLDKILGLNGHLLIQPLESPLTDWDAVADRVAKLDGRARWRRRSSRDRRWRPRRSTPPACWCAACARADLEKLTSIARNIKQGTLEGFDAGAGRRHRHAVSPSSCRCAPATTHARGAARRGDADGHHAAHQGLQGRGRLRDRHVGVRRRFRLHAADRGAGLFQSRRRRDRDRGLYRRSRPGRPLPQRSSPTPRRGRSS